MLPIITEENVSKTVEEVMKDIHKWRKDMIHYVKDENPELNTAIIELTQKSNLDPKALATGAYLAFKLLENENFDFEFEDFANNEE